MLRFYSPRAVKETIPSGSARGGRFVSDIFSRKHLNHEIWKIVSRLIIFCPAGAVEYCARWDTKIGSHPKKMPYISRSADPVPKGLDWRQPFVDGETTNKPDVFLPFEKDNFLRKENLASYRI